MTDWIKLFKQIDFSSDTKYPCDKTPGKYTNENGSKITYITAGSQLFITKKDGTEENWAPSLYQSCMNLEQKEIRTLTLILCGDEMELQTRYKSQIVRLSDTKITISPWQPVQKKKDCRSCTNCGQCSW